MNTAKEENVENSSQYPMTVREFATHHGINVTNIYYWMKNNDDIGKRDETGKHWLLFEDDEEKILEKVESRNPARKYARSPQSHRVRKRSTESPESIESKIGVDRKTARVLNFFLNPDYSERLRSMVDSVYDVKKEFGDVKEHDRVLLMMASLLDLKELSAIGPKDGYPLFKYIKPKRKSDYAVMYNMRTMVYYIDSPSKIVEGNPDLEIQPIDISLSA